MNLFGKNLDHDIVVVAEIGVNHEGSPENAATMIALAAQAGADAVKFQTYTPERYTTSSDPERLAQVSRFCLGPGELEGLEREARRHAVGFFSTPLTEDVIQQVARISDAIKIASGDIVFEPTIRASARIGKPMIISTGNATIDEIDRTIGWCKEEMGDAISERVVLLHCVAAYPTPVDQANIRSIPFLRDRYGLTVGYSSHVIESEAAIAAVALGAQILEVHFTDCREGRNFRDHQLSLDADGLHKLVESVRRVRAALGVHDKRLAAAEEPIRAQMRKGVVAARDMPAGSRLTSNDLMFARPATEIPASDVGSVIGKTLMVDRKRGQQILRDDLN